MRRTLYNWHDHLASRREFLAAALLGTAAAYDALGGGSVLEAQPADLWDTADAILKRIAAPRFPQRTFDIRKYGATTTADATAAFRAAIDACARAGGGRVLVPKGRFETGAIRNCEMRDGHGGVVIGSEVSGGARNIFAERCRMDRPRLDRVLRSTPTRPAAACSNASRCATSRSDRSPKRSSPPTSTTRRAMPASSRRCCATSTCATSPAARASTRCCCAATIGRRSPASVSSTAAFDNVEAEDVLEAVRGLTLANVRVNGERRRGSP